MTCGRRLALYADAIRSMHLDQAVGRARRLVPPRLLMTGAAPARMSEFHAAAAGLLAQWSDFDPRLRDPLTRAAVVSQMGVSAAGAAHRRAAQLMSDPARRLHHLVAATPTPDRALADDLDRLAREAYSLLDLVTWDDEVASEPRHRRVRQTRGGTKQSSRGVARAPPPSHHKAKNAKPN